MSPQEVAKLFKIGEISGEIGAVGAALTSLLNDLPKQGAPSAIENALRNALHEVVEASALVGVWAEQVSGI